jgi:hypothetical protein
VITRLYAKPCSLSRMTCQGVVTAELNPVSALKLHSKLPTWSLVTKLSSPYRIQHLSAWNTRPAEARVHQCFPPTGHAAESAQLLPTSPSTHSILWVWHDATWSDMVTWVALRNVRITKNRRVSGNADGDEAANPKMGGQRLYIWHLSYHYITPVSKLQAREF